MYFYYILFFSLGAIFGSFFNMLIYRLPRGKFFKSSSRSFCPKCKHKLSYLDLVPIFSYIFLKGKCRYCHREISLRYLLVEIISSILFILIYLKFQNLSDLNLYFNLFFISTFILIFFIDLETMLIPDILLVFGSIFMIFNLIFKYSFNINLWLNNILFAILWFFIFFLLYFFTKGKGMGFGDVKYAGYLGFIFSFNSYYVILFSFIIGGIFSLMLLVLKRKGLKDKIPFGPFLSLSAIIFLLK